MAKLWRTLTGRPATGEVARYDVSQYISDLTSFQYQGGGYAIGGSSSAWSKTEDIENSFTGYIQTLYKTNGVVYAVMAARRLLFKQARIMWQEFANGGEGELFWTDELEIFRRPWPGGTMGELLARMDQDVSLGGNFYAVRERDNGDRIRRLRPDWVTIVLTAPPAEAVQSDVAGYWYHPGRNFSAVEKPEQADEFYPSDEVCHWTPDPDPDAQYRGMSWLTPVVREVMADKAATVHKGKFFENGATLGAIISAKENLTEKQFNLWKDSILGQHGGADRAYKPMFLASPVDVTIQGLDLKQLDFKVTQGHGETRVCAAGRVPPIIVGVSEGLEAATYSNYGQARRAFGDGWAHPQWEDAIGALEILVAAPARRHYPKARLWYRYDHIPFLREDVKDAALVVKEQLLAIEAGVRAGFEPDSVRDAVRDGNLSRLEHTGLYSVQLQPPGTDMDDDGEGPPEAGEDDPGGDDEDADDDEEDPVARSRDGHELHEYWTQGAGLGRWAGSPRPFTTLLNFLRRHLPEEKARRTAADWFREVKGYLPSPRRRARPTPADSGPAAPSRPAASPRRNKIKKSGRRRRR